VEHQILREVQTRLSAAPALAGVRRRDVQSQAAPPGWPLRRSAGRPGDRPWSRTPSACRARYGRSDAGRVQAPGLVGAKPRVTPASCQRYASESYGARPESRSGPTCPSGHASFSVAMDTVRQGGKSAGSCCQEQPVRTASTTAPPRILLRSPANARLRRQPLRQSPTAHQSGSRDDEAPETPGELPRTGTEDHVAIPNKTKFSKTLTDRS
jgi:hypothetical protein